ncbi:MAG: lysophospholipase [Anaeroplasmataceae bacterium]|nr:lysophospholipase [Anaeroplasmataceae bacterium]
MWWWIVLIIILFLILVCFLMAWMIHHMIFSKRWDLDGVVQYYEFKELSTSNFSTKYKKKFLKGLYYSYPESDSKEIVVFAHGMWGSHRAYLQEIEYLCRKGFTVLGFDYYGTELSEGRSIRGLGNSLACLDVALKQVKKDYPGAKISVMGHSWGGFAALNIAAYHPDLKRVVCLAPFVSIPRIMRFMIGYKLSFLIPFFVLLDSIYCGKYSFSNGYKVLKKSGIPTMIWHSLDDQMVNYEKNTGYLKKELKNSSILYEIVDGKNHNPDYTLEAINYTKGIQAEVKTLPKERLEEYYQHVDFHKMGELDTVVMEKIVDFLH